MTNVTGIFGLLTKLESVDIAVHQNRCAVVRNRNASCMKCADACTSGCITYADNELSINPEKCIGCGTCATVCPTCALEAQHPTDAELLQSCLSAMQTTENESVIACEQILSAAEGLYDPEKVVGVACLGRVEEALITSLANEGAHRVTLVKARCETCARKTGLQTAEAVCETANTLLEAWNCDTRVILQDTFPSHIRLADDPGYDHKRRDFFSGIRGDAKEAAGKAADYAINDALGIPDSEEPKYVKVTADGTLPHFIPHRRQRLLSNLAAMGEPEDTMIGTRLWGHVVIDPEACSSCQMCATFCPTGALKKYVSADGSFGIEHSPSDCVKCRCCADICKENALWISDEVFAVDILSKAVERYEMKPIKNPPGKPSSIAYAMKDLLGIEQVYER